MAIPGLNSKIIDRLVEELGLQSAVERIPVDLAPTLQPVIVANPKHYVNVVKSGNRTTSGSGGIYTTPSSGKDFYLTGAHLSWSCDSANDSTDALLFCVLENGSTQTIIRLTKITLSAVNYSQYVSFPVPIKLKPGTSISISSSFGAGSSNLAASINGYTQDIL